MALTLPDHWMWDHWIVDDGERYHLFFLRASRALHDPERRHMNASMGHAVSADARGWELLPDALVHSDGPSFDDKAIWTGVHFWYQRPSATIGSLVARSKRIPSAESAQPMRWAIPPSARDIPV